MAWEETPQGYIKTKAILTRSGAFDYFGHEIGLTDKLNDKVQVYRDIKDLSSDETLKSFDGLPITLTHPDSKAVDSADWKKSSVGHVQNARIDGDNLIADVVIQDKSAVDFLKKHKEIREVSVGYEPADIQKIGDKYYHKSIRANHVAIVSEGRAGSNCKLIDKLGEKMNLKSIIAILKGKRTTDSEGATLTTDELTQMIAALEEALKEFEGKDDEDSKQQAAELQKQIDDLKAKLDAPAPADEEPATEDSNLIAENEALKAKIAELETKIAELEAQEDKANALSDAKARFPKINLTDAATGKDIRIKVLVDCGAFTKEQASKLSDVEIRSAYAALQAVNAKKNNFANTLFSDSKPQQKQSASKRLGGK